MTINSPGPGRTGPAGSEMKTQIENSQEEVTTGAHGVTRGQKGPERDKKVKLPSWHHITDQKRCVNEISTQNQVKKWSKTKEQLESSPAEVTTGAQGVTSGHKGPSKAFLSVFLPHYRCHSKAHANLPDSGRIDPTGPEKINMIFRILRTAPFMRMNSDSCPDPVLGVYESHF